MTSSSSFAPSTLPLSPRPIGKNMSCQGHIIMKPVQRHLGTGAELGELPNAWDVSTMSSPTGKGGRLGTSIRIGHMVGQVPFCILTSKTRVLGILCSSGRRE